MLAKLFRHKLITIILIISLVGVYFGYKILKSGSGETRYTFAAVEKGTLIVSVSGSGQVAVSDQIDVKPKVSGDVVYVGVETGQEVKAGTLIAQLDTRDAQKTVLDAENNLADAELTLKNTEGKAEEALATTYEDGLNVLTNTFKDLSPMMSGLKDTFKIFLESSYSGDESDIDYYLRLVRAYSSDSSQLSYWAGGAEQKYLEYLAVQTQFDAVQAGYWALRRSSPHEQIEIILNQTYDTTQTILDLVQATLNLEQKYQTLLDTENLTSPISTTTSNSQISQLNGFTSSLINLVDALSSAKLSLSDKKKAVAKEDLDIEAQNLTVKQRQYALSDAKENLVQHDIRVPFDGIITKINVKKGDSVSASTILINLITKQKIAEITLNEIDAAKVKVGQKSTLTFDALPEVTISGKVIEVDAVGTANQGVVSYGVKIAFDTEEEKVKPGMSVTADIITEAKPDVLVLPSNAIKSQGGAYYVELVEADEELSQQLLANVSGTILPKPPKLQLVETGLSNDLSTEIVSGLEEGDVVVASTINTSATQTTKTRTNQSLQIPGMSSGGGVQSGVQIRTYSR